MSRIMTIYAASGILVALAFSGNVAGAGTVTVHTTAPTVKVQVPTAPSHSVGAGAGRVQFNPFSITKKTDKASPVLFGGAGSAAGAGANLQHEPVHAK